MDRQEAIKTLIRAGRGDEISKTIQKWVSRANDKHEDLRNDHSRTEEYRRWGMAVATKQADQALTDELVSLAASAGRYERDDASRVFGVAGMSGDAASLVISRRDAGDRAARVTRKDELMDLVVRATRSGDEILARAAAERATELQYAEVVNKFLETRPNLESAAERLWDAQNADAGTAVMQFTMQLSAMKPKELVGESFGSIRAMAAAGEPGAGGAARWA